MADNPDDTLVAAGDALISLAEGPGVAAARALEAAFAEAGASIEASLARAAERGRLDFEDMAEAIARDLARLAVSSVFGSGAPGAVQQTLNVTLPQSGGNASRNLLANRGALEALMARFASLGGRL
ncbi:MAG: hypothetical protein MRY64_16695 [Hyphomonadaceae bacterium]|nr:hypothetical protein [Hyphomonadaceae bacterium]